MPLAINKNEEIVYEAVRRGALEILPDGTIWRLYRTKQNQWRAGQIIKPCRVRAEKACHRKGKPETYLYVRASFNGKRVSCLAQRLVWLHFNGPIPDGITVNHKDGNKKRNAPENLDLMTHAEQIRHAARVLCVMKSKITVDDVREIRKRYASGEPSRLLAAEFRISQQQINRIHRRERWSDVA